LENIKVIVVAGPGNPKERFVNKLKTIGNFETDA
jgi:stalled ribosome rescue protein Dom34